MWCVDEVREAVKSNLKIYGLFDPAIWDLSKFQKTMKVETRNAECSNDEDKLMLTNKIEEAGGFDELDKVILHVRKMAKKDLKEALSFEANYGTRVSFMDIVPKEEEANEVDDDDSSEEFSA